MDAVRRCWASLWTGVPSPTGRRQGIDPRGVRIAVVVQQMVDAEVAGVLFTADPVTGRRRRTVIDASPGLGEAVVSGAVNPDHVIVDTDSGAVVERRPGDKRLAIRLPSRRRHDARRGAPVAGPVLPDRRPAAHGSPRWGPGSSSTSARRRTSSGPSTPTARRG